jgi:L-threonylcarbamoyladenylate synthase
VSARIFSPSEIKLDTVLEHISKGHLVAIPTETVYGLAANARDELAIQKIFDLKNRPQTHPLIVHIAPPKQSDAVESYWEESLAKWSDDVCEEAIILAKAYWPGPLTLILKKSKQVSSMITGGQNTVGIRAPNHPWTIEILQAFQGGLVAPSANRFGRISPTTAGHVFDEFNKVETETELMILDGGPCVVGIESTIVDLSRIDTLGPVILRPGVLSEKDICETLGVSDLQKKDQSIRHSGGMLGHYAPHTRLISKSVASLIEEDFDLEKIVVITFLNIDSLKKRWQDKSVDWIQIPLDSLEVARSIYRLLRELDQGNYRTIIFDQLPNTSEWAGVNDRLTRSVYGSGLS